jgi:mono/diheme cytochrome c family protein
MSFKDRIPALAVTAVLIGGVGIIISNMTSGPGNGMLVDVKIPTLSAEAKAGEAIFTNTCAACHGQNAGGSDQGPPLVFSTYNPGHHADAAFYLAAERGVRQHHWRFGNMPAQPGVSKSDIQSVISYVRELQQANGIFFKPHNM